MPCDTPCHPPVSSSANAYAGRDRVLLYTRGMNAAPVKGIELALQSMRQAGENAPPGEVMEQLFHILREEHPATRLTDGNGDPLVSAPPMNRTAMIAEDMDQLSLSGSFLRWLRKRFTSGGKGGRA
ncbi:hypothetical protein LJC26_02035 [Desulfovibrio sp. OttesenSCG-928-O18]|nr:hypothetical protein [Desulfovibrio sp. OttesenSCG-928-O18]